MGFQKLYKKQTRRGSMEDFSSMPDGFDGSKSGFNEAAYMMVRLHQLQTGINQARLNPLGSDPQTGTPYYKLWLSCLDALYSEMSGKFEEKQKKELKAYQQIIRSKLLTNPIYRRSYSAVSGTSKMLFNQSNWIDIEHLLMQYEEKLKLYKEEHGLGNPNMGTAGLFG